MVREHGYLRAVASLTCSGPDLQCLTALREVKDIEYYIYSVFLHTHPRKPPRESDDKWVY